jgi:hypothetical protein
MLLMTEWTERFLHACAKVRSARRRSLGAGQSVYVSRLEGRCWVVAAGYVKLLDPRVDGDRFIRLILDRGDLFGDRPFGARAFAGFASPQHEQASPTGRRKFSNWIARNLKPRRTPRASSPRYCSNQRPTARNSWSADCSGSSPHQSVPESPPRSGT